MTDKTNWTPKVGDRVMAVGTIVEIDSESVIPIRVRCDHGEHPTYFTFKELSPLPAPREPWEVLREAHKLMLQEKPRIWYGDILDVAAKLEAAAAPKLPTLVEAVRAYSQKLNSGASEVGAEYATMMAALARAEAGQ